MSACYSKVNAHETHLSLRNSMGERVSRAVDLVSGNGGEDGR